MLTGNGLKLDHASNRKLITGRVQEQLMHTAYRCVMQRLADFRMGHHEVRVSVPLELTLVIAFI